MCAQASLYSTSVCHDVGSLNKLLWPMSAIAPPPGTPVVVSPLSTLLATAYTQQPRINISASVRVWLVGWPARRI